MLLPHVVHAAYVHTQRFGDVALSMFLVIHGGNEAVDRRRDLLRARHGRVILKIYERTKY